MITIILISWFIYMGFGLTLIGYLCNRYLDDDKICVNCVFYGLFMVWTFLPLTIALDLYY
jgi:hypothetical protein